MKSLAVAVVLLVGSTAASAQDASKGDVFAGYSMLATDGAEGETMHGWHAALGWGLSGRFGLLLDVSGHYGTVEGTDVRVALGHGGSPLHVRRAGACGRSCT